MSESLPHIIHRQVLDLQLPANRFDGIIEEHVKNLFYAALPQLDAVLTQHALPQQQTRIDRLFIDLGTLPLDKLDERFASQLCTALSRALKEAVSLGASTPLLQRDTDPLYDAPSLIPDIKEDGAETTTYQLHNVSVHSLEQGLAEAFCYFLQQGLFPWWMSHQINENMTSVFEPLWESPSIGFMMRVKALLVKDPNAVRRLLNQFTEAFISRLEKHLLAFSTAEVAAVYELLPPKDGNVFTRITDLRASYTIDWQAWRFHILLAPDRQTALDRLAETIREVMVNKVASKADLQLLLQTASFALYQQEILQRIPALSATAAGPMNKPEGQDAASAVAPPGSTQPATPSTSSATTGHTPTDMHEDSTANSLFTDHAGLVLLHPYLPRLFDKAGLLNEQRHFIHDTAQMKAVYLLAYLATGRTDVPETTLPFCKFLCGMPLHKAIGKSEPVDAPTKDLCESLLQAVISHWAVLGNSSPDGLREGFLTRKGKLDMRDEPVVVHIERTTIDILLDRLPWGIGIIALPWLPQPFNTIWT